MRQVNIAMLLIEQGNNYLLQLRDGHPKIGAAGLVGCFGGKIDSGEAPKNAAIREVAEETNLGPNHPDVIELGIVNVESDHQHEQVKVKAHVFRVVVGPKVKLQAKEGKLIIMPKDQVRENISKLTPATRACFEELI